MNRLLLTLFSGTAILSGCTASDVPITAFGQRDSAGIHILDLSGEPPAWTAGSDTIAFLGVVDGEAAHQFQNIIYAGRLSDGRILVVDGRSQELRWFTASGAHERTAGGRGAGPGEFTDITDVLLLSGDTVVMHDPRNQRVTWMSPAGQWIRDRRLEGGRSNRLLAATGDIIIASRQESPTDYSRELSLTGQTVRFIRIADAGADTVAEFRGPSTAKWVRYVNGRPTMSVSGGLPFESATLVGMSGSWIILGFGDSPSLHFLRTDGSPERIVRSSPDLYQPVTQHHRQRYVEHGQALAAARGGSASDAAERAREYLKLLPEGHLMPVFDRLLVASNGSVWLRRYRAAWEQDLRQTWLILQEDGYPDGEVTLNPGFEVLHADHNTVTGVVKDEMDVEHVLTVSVKRDD